ncbi:MAG: hypothetical protein SGCHY_001586 [Lobulomycetales sp.]
MQVAVQYCSLCTFPYEYCEFGPSKEPCREALRQQEDLVDLFSRLYPDFSKNLDGEGKAAESTEGQAKTIAARKKTEKKKTVTIKRDQRSKRKSTVTISGLESFGIDLKKAAKLCANKFATGASVTKNVHGLGLGDDIVIQGDVQDEVFDLILATWPEVPEENISIVEGKTKK